MTRALLFLAIHAIFISDIYAEDRIPKVPGEMQFAGMKLKITEAAKKDIQKDVDALRSNPKYFNIKLDRVKLYFPIIERVLKDADIPDDFKYLAVQESALISDAVSSADAVGFWQFKDFTGREVGLRIDRYIDERLNIVSSTYGAAKYFKRHNFYFNNWVYTLLAHMTGRGGAAKFVKESNFGARKMTIDRNTHWYIKRFLAHKIAFEGQVKGRHSEGLRLTEFTKGRGKSLDEIAKDFKIDQDELKRYNKWLKRGKIPSEKDYTVIIPILNKVPKGLSASRERSDRKDKNVDETSKVRKYPSIAKNLNTSKTIFIKINGIQSILAKKTDTPESLAQKGNTTLARFLKYNDLKSTDVIKEGEIYYLRKKKNKANIHYYTIQEGENLWDVSQKFGIKLKKLAKYNRMLTIDEPTSGRVMWLREQRPKNVTVEIIRQLPVQPQSGNQTQNVVRDSLRNDSISDLNSQIQTGNKDNEVMTDTTSITKNSTTSDEIRNEDTVVDDGQFPSLENEEKPTPSEVFSGSNKNRHMVERGETLYGIARKYGVSIEELMLWNKLNNATLSIGQSLLVERTALKESVGKEINPENSVTFHVVEPGDTMYQISKKYNISVEKILEINQKDNFDLSVGEKLRIRE